MNILKYIFSKQYRAEIKHQQLIAKHKQALIDLAELYANVISEALFRKKVCYIYTNKQTKEETIAYIEFDLIEITSDYYIFWVEYPLPIGKGYDDLIKPEVLNYVEMLVRAPLTWRYQQRKGFRYMVQRGGRIGGLPATVEYKKVMEMVPKNTPGTLYFPVGIGDNNTLYHCDLEEVAHFIIAGATNYGKSNALAQIICSLCELHSPQKLKMIFIDLKDLDLHLLEDMPHLGVDGSEWAEEYHDLIQEIYQEDKPPDYLIPNEKIKTITNGKDALKILEWAKIEKERRAKLIKNAKVRKLSSYNKKFKGSNIPHIVIVFDELSLIMLDKRYSSGAQYILADLTATSRATGIHLILCTQVLTSKVLPALINGNVPGRLALYATTGTTAGLATGDGTYDAHTKINGVIGRALYIGGKHNKVLIQTPLITDFHIKKTIETINERWSKAETPITYTEKEIFNYVLNDLDGFYDWKTVHSHFKDVGATVRDIKNLAKNNEVKEVDGTWQPILTLNGGGQYILAPRVSGRNGYNRRLTLYADWLNANPINTKQETKHKKTGDTPLHVEEIKGDKIKNE